MTSSIGMGNSCSKGNKKKKSARVANATHGSDKAESLIHSERSNPNKVERIKTNDPNHGRLLISKGDFINEHTAENIREEYQIGKVLGTGAFGEVRVCTHRKSGIKRAVKILKKNFLKEEEQKKFFHEIEILKKMDHPNIVRLFEVYQDHKRYFIITELCTGGELFDQIIKRPYYSERDAAIIMKQVLSAVGYCHAENIVHRDLKPENLLLDSDGAGAIIKVIDFGTSQKYDPDKKMHQTYGTPYYIAPEILAGEYNEKWDVWSCGVIMYILLCGRPPFDGQTDDEILENVSKGMYKTDSAVWKNVSKEGLELVTKMMKFDPEARISASDALNHEWIKNLTEGINVDENLATGALMNLKEFRAERKLQQAVCTFMVSQMATKEEMEELQKAFSSLDKNGDGKLSREELLTGFTDIMGATAAEEEVERIMNLVDTDQNGWIDYSEFVMATLNKKNLLSDERLEAAFKIFDKDNNGFIDSKEIRAVLGKGKNLEDHVWEELISEVDINGDGEVSFKEFRKMMQQLIGGGNDDN